MQWFAPDDPRERARLDAWCAGVGGAIQTTAAPAAPETIGIEDITFVSWNVHVGSGDIRAFVKDLTSGDHTEGRPVRHYVLMLQEAVRTEGAPPLTGGARAPLAFARTRLLRRSTSCRSAASSVSR